ncbi:hypothetical protein MKW98_013763 [Papaver atlanticum]|uniref:SMP domain-containing protein n=1 Tax=Papaver atlanticum TaxID=357466 RepID=A0AAD4TDE6_9MAGN|nr:hypothetical protein MKW98_013763 [Papaver atlanticum]
MEMGFCSILLKPVGMTLLGVGILLRIYMRQRDGVQTAHGLNLIGRSSLLESSTGSSLLNILDAAFKLPADKEATPRDAEGVVGAEMRNNPNLVTHPGDVAASVVSAARRLNKLDQFSGFLDKSAKSPTNHKLNFLWSASGPNLTSTHANMSHLHNFWEDENNVGCCVYVPHWFQMVLDVVLGHCS